MGSFRVEIGPLSHDVFVGADLLDRLGELALGAGLKPGRAALVTDSTVNQLYGSRAAKALESHGFETTVIEVAAGEASKSLEVLGEVYDRLVEARLDRASTIFALGGGVVGDLAGFAAATYLRGIPLVQVPTTMLAQVDSALGGKTAVNHRAAKNLIGAFYQPRLVAADVSTLGSLPEREYREGLAEVIKYGAIMDADMVGTLETGMHALLARDNSRLEAIIERSLRHKAAVVAGDEREGGRRKILNFGHTIGHALEAGSGYGNYLHGEAVAIGMVAAAKLSSLFSGLRYSDSDRLEHLIEIAGLPTEMPEGWFDEHFVRALKLDKKRADGAIEFVLLDRLGHAFTRKLGFDEIIAGINESGMTT